MPAVLNLSNEVVKLRVEVKRVKVLLIRKLIRQMSALEKKKGSQADLERQRRRAARLQEEIHELKVILPDRVTKAALQKDISFEEVCQNKESSLSERAIARIATHPQFSKKIQSIKEAIKAFKEERINARKAEKQVKNNAEDITLQDQPQEGSDDAESSEKLDDKVEEKLKEEEGDKMIDKEEICGSSQVSQKTSLEASNIKQQTNQCPEMSATQDSAKQVSIPEEVVRMRKEVKRTRVLVISKLTQQVAVLKKRKGQESEVKQGQELAAELMKNIQALRSLNPDHVTMAALQENTEFEKILQDPQASLLDRAIARIVTHSRFKNRLQKVKEAIQEERTKAAEAEEKKKARQAMMQPKNRGEDDDNEGEDKDDEEDDNKEDDEEEKEKLSGEEKMDSPSMEIHKSTEPTESTDSDAVKLPPFKEITTPSEKPRGAKVKSQNAGATASESSPKKALTLSSTELPKNVIKSDREMENTIKPQKKQDLPETKQPESKRGNEESDLSDDDEESDLSDNDEEKEYFDDSTEERFHKQSSQSEESDDDDFFLGKVSKFKKKKSGQGKGEEKKGEPQTADKLQNVEKATSKLPESNLGKFQSVFCSTLSKSSISSKIAKPGSRHDGPRPPHFENQKRGPEGKMKPSLYKDPGTDRRAAPFKHDKQTFKFAGQRQGGPSGSWRGKSQFEQHQNQNPRGLPGRTSNAPQQSLHPSWEASRKRKEQQAQITAFQGKKIKFDDDD